MTHFYIITVGVRAACLVVILVCILWWRRVGWRLIVITCCSSCSCSCPMSWRRTWRRLMCNEVSVLVVISCISCSHLGVILWHWLLTVFLLRLIIRRRYHPASSIVRLLAPSNSGSISLERAEKHRKEAEDDDTQKNPSTPVVPVVVTIKVVRVAV